VNEVELIELLMDWFAQISTDADRYFALVSAYLLVAYLAGTKLTTFQLAIVNTLFLLWIAGIVAGTFSALEATVIIESRLDAMGSEFGVGRGAEGLYNFIVIQVGGVVASLFFMWSVRHPREK
jgi:hypothetical protein